MATDFQNMINEGENFVNGIPNISVPTPGEKPAGIPDLFAGLGTPQPAAPATPMFDFSIPAPAPAVPTPAVPTPAVEVAPAAPPKVEVEKKEEPKAKEAVEEKEEAKAETKEEATEAPAEEKPKKRRRRKTVEATVSTDEETAKKNETFVMPIDPTLSISKVVEEMALAPDNDFIEAKQSIEEKMNAIQVHKDLDKANINLLYQRIDELNNIIHENLEMAKSQYENFTSKDGFLQKAYETNMSGSSAEERKRNATLALMKYKMKDGTSVNLYQVAWALRHAANFFNDAADQLETKRRLIKGIQDSILIRQ